MRQRGLVLSFLVLIACAPGNVAAEHPARVQPVKQRVKQNPETPDAAFMRVFGQTAPPIGYVQFCDRMPAECDNPRRDDQRVELTPTRLSEIDRINRVVNKEIQPATDLELYGVEEFWTYPDARMKGDCEDYVLLKRRLLIDRGWSQGALLITVVRDEHKEGHAILTVRTLQGDFILDNKNDEIKPWHRTPYQYIMRQSYISPRVWMSLEPLNQVASTAVAVLRRER